MAKTPAEIMKKIGETRAATWAGLSKTTPSLDLSDPAAPAVALKGDFTYKGRPFNHTVALTMTSKMSAFSFSLPSLHPDFLGACPAQNVILQGDYIEKYRINDFSQHGPKTRTRPQDFICSGCYAAGGFYSMPNVVLAQMGRFHYVRYTLESKGWKALAKEIDRAIKVAYGRPRFKTQEAAKYFRIHDSGDFFTLDYLRAWLEVCRRNSGITFWAPVRVWTQPGFLDLLAEAPGNLMVRPSALQFEDPAPLIEPLALGSTSSKDNVMRSGLADWECPAYAYGAEHKAKYGEDAKPSCGQAFQFVPANDRAALAKMTRTAIRKGDSCRVCWDHPDVSVSYRKHTLEEIAKKRKKAKNPPMPALSTMFQAFQKSGKARNPGSVLATMSEFGSAIGEAFPIDSWTEEDWDRFADEYGLGIGEVGTAQEALASWLV